MRKVWMRLASELRPAVRRLHRRAGFTVAAVVPLAVGLGATAAIFSLVHDVVLGRLPYAESDRLVVVRHTLAGFQGDGDLPEVGAFLGQLLHYQERSRLLTDVGGYWTFGGTLTGDGGAEYLHLGGVTAGLLGALAVRPVEGRLFDGSAPWPGGEGTGVTLLSHGFWQARYGGTRSAVGRTITAQGWSYEVVGVLPSDFPLASTRPVLWHAIPDRQARENPQLTVPALVGRLAPGATVESLERELATLTSELPERYPDGTNIRNAVERGRMTPRVIPLREWLTGDVDRALWLLFASVALLLMVAIGNVAMLFVVDAESTRRDHAVRLALGSGRRGVVVRTLLHTGLVVGVAAGAAVVLARAGIVAVMRWVAAGIPRAEAVAVGQEEVVFVLALAVVATVVLTAIQDRYQRNDVVSAILNAGRGGAALHARRGVQHAFVGIQVAVAVVLMVGGGLIAHRGHLI